MLGEAGASEIGAGPSSFSETLSGISGDISSEVDALVIEAPMIELSVLGNVESEQLIISMKPL